MFTKYDVIVVGAGHAGCEAAHAAANMGSLVLLITTSLQNIGLMSCNPAMGGIGKGQLIREIDALGGGSGIVSDKSMIQFRMLNKSKGPGMWSPRSQNDRSLFASVWRDVLESTDKIHFWQDTVSSLIVSRGTIKGVKTSLGITIESKTVVLTNGTFLNGTIHIGKKQFGGGRLSESRVTGLTEQLKNLGFNSERLKTGTPPRIDGRSINYDVMEEQFGDDLITGFSFLETPELNKKNQKSCWITYTSTAVHEELKKGFSESPMFNGNIKSTGPRYCPSIEDKINRFADRDQHQLFIEPDGWGTTEVYVNGFSTSLPEEIQYKALQKVAGLENCRMLKPGYAIEYDYFQPTQLHNTLETKKVKNLFFAGQINGTTGYEEAACQGLIAGINASNTTRNLDSIILSRDEAYIGVLIDDLISKGTDEPYRMFTSRAEYRTLLRQDNADMRLTKMGYKLGLANADRYNKLEKKENAVNEILQKIASLTIDAEGINKYLEDRNSAPITERTKIIKLLLRPRIYLIDLIQNLSHLKNDFGSYNILEIEQADIQTKYSTYIQKEYEIATKIKNLDNQVIPESFDYENIVALGTEAKQKLNRIKPTTIGQASRISGINPTDIQILLVFLER